VLAYTKMKFAHFADCHIGGWRDPKLKELPLKCFTKAMEQCLNEKVDFILISGDLFNTSLPSIDSLKEVVTVLKKIKDNNVETYIIAGSHDFSPSGKTMIDVLENAGLCINVTKGDVIDGKLKLKFTEDRKTGAKITGMLGKKGSLEKKYYEDMIKENLENEKGFKIFMFHSAISELKPKDLEAIEAQPLSFLPKNFDYYAAGHVHERIERKIDGYGLIVYPGPLFPNNFKELEKSGGGGFYIYEDGKLAFNPIKVCNVYTIDIDCNHKTPKKIEEEIMKDIKNKEFYDTIVTIKLHGVLESGKPSDIDFKLIFTELYSKSAYFVMRNIFNLASKEMDEIKISEKTSDEIENLLIKEHLGQIKVDGMTPDTEETLVRSLISMLDMEKVEGETSDDFEKRVVGNIGKIIEF